MKKALFALIPALLFASCSFWNEPVEEFFSYWSSEAFITDSSVKVPNQSDKAGVVSVSSDAPAEVILNLSNPKSFRFVMPAVGNSEMIRFGGLETQPVPGTDYTLTQMSSDALKLTYKTAFLKQHEWGNGDLGATLTLFADDGRKFKKPYGFNLKANTPPPTPTAVLAQTAASYVLCFTVPDMGVMVNGERLHKDIAQIEINGTKYPLTVESSDFKKPDDPHFILAGGVTQLTEPHSAPVPAGAWVLYYNTGVPLGAGHQAYTVKLKDDKDLVSKTLETGTTLNEPPAEIVTVTAGEQSTGSGTDTAPFIIKGAASVPEARLEIKNVAGTTVHCTVTEVVGTAAPARYDGNPVTFPLGLDSADEKTYKVEYYTDGIGYKSNSVKTKYYKVLKQHTVTFNANGGAYTGGATTRTALVPHTMTATAPAATDNPTRQGYTFGGWYKNADCSDGQKWDFATDTVNDDTTLYAQWNPASGTEYKVKHYQENLDGTYPSTPTDIESRTGQTDHTFTAAEINGMKKTTYQGFEFDKQELNHPSIKADGTTIIKLFYKRKTVTVTFKLNGGKISGDPSDVTRADKYGAPLAKPADPTKPGYTFSDWQPTPPALALSSTFPAANAEYTAKWTGNTYYVQFNGKGNDGGSMSTQTFTYGTTQKLSKNTFTKTGYKFMGWAVTSGGPVKYADEAEVTNLTPGANTAVLLYAVWEIKTYTVTFSVEGGEGSLKGEGGGYINTADGTAPKTLTVKHGENVVFTATPKSGAWKVAGWMKNNAEVNGTTGTYTLSNVTENTTVKVRFYQPEIAGTAPMAWRDLLSAVRNAPANATITINGEINATHISGNNGEIVINKNLTIKGKKTDGSDTLNAITLSRIFKVKTGNTLTLENITLKNGKAPDDPEAGDTKDGGGIYSEGTLTLNNTTITSCGAKNGGGIYAQGGAEITLTNTEINSCVAEENGGGLYIKDSRLTLTNATIGGEQLCTNSLPNKAKGNKAKNGGGIFLTGSGTDGSRMTGGKVSYNLATDGTYAKGGGIYIQESASFTMQSGNINSNEVKTGTVEDGGGVYVRGQGSGSGTHATFTLNGGTIGDNYAGFGGGVMVTAGGSCTMNNGTMSENRANYGGGVCAKKEDSADGVFTMKNGTITGNRAYQDGGAAEVHGIFTWEGGDITGNHVNTAPRGQIIHRDGGHFNNNCHGTVS